MVFRKYRPVKQWGKMDTRIFKQILNARNQRPMTRFFLPDAIKELGVTVHDPNAKGFFESESVQAAQSAHQQQQNKPANLSAIKDHPLFNKVASLLFDGSDPMSDGMAQACVISKAILRTSFPEHILKNALVDFDEDKVRDSILHGERYDPTLEKLPRRFDPVLFWVTHPRVHGTPVVKRGNIILNNLYRHILLAAAQSGAVSMEQFRLDRDEPLSACLSAPPLFQDRPLVVRGQPHLTAQTTLERKTATWATKEEVEELKSALLESVYPISPIIDLGSDHIYNRDSILARSLYASSLRVHAILWAREQNQKYPWTTEQNAANAILYTFGAAVAEAMKLGKDRDLSSSPVVTRGVQLVDGRLDLVAFQLNTLDLSDENPIKNVVWVERGCRLYKPKPFYEQMTSVEELNMTAFAKLSALILS